MTKELFKNATSEQYTASTSIIRM